MITEREYLILRGAAGFFGHVSMLRHYFTLYLGRPVTDDEARDAYARLSQDHAEPGKVTYDDCARRTPLPRR